MKRFWMLAILAVVTLAFAGPTWAASGSSITVKPSEMKEGETKTFTDDGKTITIRRDGDTTHVRIEGAGETRNLTITKDGKGKLVIGREGSDRLLITGPDRQRIIIDGIPLDVPMAPRKSAAPRQRMKTMFVCPKDGATLQVPREKENDTFKCPVDGTTMEKRKGRGFSFFFDEGVFEGEEL